MKLQNLRFFSVENRHGVNHLLREEGTGKSSVTEKHIFCSFPMLISRPYKMSANVTNLQSLADKAPKTLISSLT